MFDFEKLEVYQILHGLNMEVLRFLIIKKDMDEYLKDQLKRATLSVELNLAEGVGRQNSPDKKRFLTIARSSVFECTAIINILKDLGQLDLATHKHFYDQYTSVSKMLLAMYRSYQK